LEDKPAEQFNREHVVPEAFGLFEQNLVLECVCRACNDHFGRTLDLKLARDTVEGLDRFRNGLKPVAAYKGLGRRSTSRFEVMEGPLKGVLCEARPSVDGRDLDVAHFLPQLGFSQAEDGPFEFHPLESIPSKDDLIARGFKSPVYVRVYGASWEEGMAQLLAKGFPPPEQFGQTNPLPERTRVDYVFKISHPEFRAISKIAMNYFAAVATPSIACMTQFNDCRRYIRHDARPEYGMVEVIRPQFWIKDGRRVRCHYVAVESRGDEILGQVSLFGRLRYLVRLSTVPFMIASHLRQAHVFDLERTLAYPVEPPAL
jgi:hypothetical protein